MCRFVAVATERLITHQSLCVECFGWIDWTLCLERNIGTGARLDTFMEGMVDC